MRTETELTPDHLSPGDLFRWEPDGELWVVVERAERGGVVARPWHPAGWPEENRRAPALYQLHPDRRVWRVTPDE